MLKYKLLIFSMLLFAQYTFGMWDFAVTAKTKIIFYDENWKEVTTSAHQFDQLSAITFDETEEIVYFNDRLHNNGSIFSLKIPSSSGWGGQVDDPSHIIEKVLQRTQEEMITSIAYDPLQRHIYWADQKNKKIYFISIEAAEKDLPKVLVDFTAEKSKPDGIAIDICRRKLYWTNSNFRNASIERIDLDGNDRRVIIQDGLYLPHGIVIDQLSDRIYWVVDQQGIHYTVESAFLDGSDRRVIVQGLDSSPSNLAVSKDLIFWTDSRHNAIWTHRKVDAETKENITDDQQLEENTKPQIILKLLETPSGIVARSRYMTTLQNDQHCADVIKEIRSNLKKSSAFQSTTESGDSQRADIFRQRDFCLNGGEYISQSGICICKIGFKGVRCEINECHNYCVHGTCSLSSNAFPKCNCQHGYFGDRCQSNRCSGFCFNEGTCKIENSGEPTCECKETFAGKRCEQNLTEVCALFCRILVHEPDTYVPFGCHDICEQLAEENDDGQVTYAIPTYKHLEVCKNHVTWTNTLIIVLVAGIVSCLCLVLLIVHGVRRFYKPLRPRIKKTFVVRRPATDTPLTNRPITTEQCEITIENCCNMNYCDTPCFDPKSLSCGSGNDTKEDKNIKEDKKVLIHSMDDDLY